MKNFTIILCCALIISTMIGAAGSVKAEEFEFTFDYLGYVTHGHPDWYGPYNPAYPYQHKWMLNIMQWDPTVQYVSDVDVEAPHIIPGYVEVVPPPNWAVGPWYIGRYSYEANPGQEITVGGGTFGWSVNGKQPYVVPGVVYLTKNRNRVSQPVHTLVVGPKEPPKPNFVLDTEMDWLDSMNGQQGLASVGPMPPGEWDKYISMWNSGEGVEGERYPSNTTFLPPILEVYGGGDGGGIYPEDAGLVMMWGHAQLAEGEYASAWRYSYPEDPDLRNKTIKVTVTPPSSCNINAVSFAIVDAAGLIRSWWWKVPSVIPYDVPTTVTINTAKTGVAAASPIASGYLNTPGFNLANAQFFDVDENGKWIFGMMPVPPPGQPQFGGMWNYWHNLIVLPNVGHGKSFIKWSQPPDVIDPNNPKLIRGWDELSNYYWRPIVADDWYCRDNRPVTDIHWWGSFLGWNQPYPPPAMPKAFHIGIWSDVAAGKDPDSTVTYSHPGVLIWENICKSYVWNFEGYDVTPFAEPGAGEPFYKETCFQFNQLLSEDQWFYQKPEVPWSDDPCGAVYWLSIAAVYDPDVDVPHPWGWKTRQPHWNDDAVVITDTQYTVDYPWPYTPWPPFVGCVWNNGFPIEYPQGVSWDMSFELTTNEPEPIPPDTTPPSPDPMTWELLPEKIGSIAVKMTATTASDPSGPVEYYFDETSGNPGGDDSGWQRSTGYVDVGLDPNTTYAYMVRARDSVGNTTGWSPSISETTAPVCADLYKDANDIVDFRDFGVLANQWLESCP